MEGNNAVITIILIALATAGITFVYLLCRMTNVGKNERKAKMNVKKSDYDTKAKRD